MKGLDGNTDCPCGDKLAFKLAKPSAFTPLICAVKCPGCASTFLVKAMVGKDRKVDVSVAIQELSPKCTEVLQRAIDARNRHEQDEPGRADGNGAVTEDREDPPKHSHH